MRIWHAIVGAAVAVGLIATGTAVAAAHGHGHGRGHDRLDHLRAVTARFRSIATAEQHGYALLPDAKGIACIDMPAMPGMPGGAMGVHWANSTLVGDPAIVPDQPEAMVYAPERDGTLRLGAVEYVVLKDAWDAANPRPPKLFGHTFNLTDAPNRFGLPAFYSLHVWAWKHNPAGTFEMFNPKVSCAASN